MSEILEFVHEHRKAGFTFSAIAGKLQVRFGVNIGRRQLNAQYARWCQDNDVKHVRDMRVYHSPKSGGKRGKIKYNQSDINRRDCMLHLLDLVRAHGGIVTNSLTGEVVEGGFPNVNIPDTGTPVVINAHYHGSLTGSHALCCAEWGK